MFGKLERKERQDENNKRTFYSRLEAPQKASLSISHLDFRWNRESLREELTMRISPNASANSQTGKEETLIVSQLECRPRQETKLVDAASRLQLIALVNRNAVEANPSKYPQMSNQGNVSRIRTEKPIDLVEIPPESFIDYPAAMNLQRKRAISSSATGADANANHISRSNQQTDLLKHFTPHLNKLNSTHNTELASIRLRTTSTLR